MQLLDYGLWALPPLADILSATPIEDRIVLGDLPNPINIYYNGRRAMEINWGTDFTKIYCKDPDFKTLSRFFLYKEDFSNQRLRKILKRAIKRYQGAVRESPARNKSAYVKNLDELLEVLCLPKNTGS
jgi:hypothetical protein